jgi:hypothetical protein
LALLHLSPAALHLRPAAVRPLSSADAFLGLTVLFSLLSVKLGLSSLLSLLFDPFDLPPSPLNRMLLPAMPELPFAI